MSLRLEPNKWLLKNKYIKNLFMLQVLVTIITQLITHFVKTVIIIMEKEQILKKFGEHIKRIRESADLSQDDVVLNGNRITKATVSDIENGKRNFSFTTLIDLAKGLGKTPKELLDINLEK